MFTGAFVNDAPAPEGPEATTGAAEGPEATTAAAGPEATAAGAGPEATAWSLRVGGMAGGALNGLTCLGSVGVVIAGVGCCGGGCCNATALAPSAFVGVDSDGDVGGTVVGIDDASLARGLATSLIVGTGFCWATACGDPGVGLVG